jgi:hypothetical protein
MTTRLLFLLPLAVILSPPSPVLAQPQGDTTQVDAIRCWRRVDRNAVHVGERFTMTVTCRVVETDTARTLPDQTALEPETIDVAPFEVLGGELDEDIRTGPYRFFQYHYTLRVINESDFGEDIDIPALDLTYRIERRVDNNPALLGRELTYVLPAEPVRVVSLVPDAIVDIRDLSPATIGDAQARVFRANVLTLLAALFGVVAVGVVALGAVRVARERRSGTARVAKRIQPLLVVHRALGELTRVRQATTEHGWNVESAGRALAALRVAGAVAVSAPVAQAPVAVDAPARDGQLRVRHGLLRPKTTVISSGLTATDLTRRLARTPAGRVDGAASDLVDDLGRAISVFTTARYSRDDSLPADALTRELDTGIVQLTRLRWRSAALVRYAAALRAAAGNWWDQVWTR